MSPLILTKLIVVKKRCISSFILNFSKIAYCYRDREYKPTTAPPRITVKIGNFFKAILGAIKTIKTMMISD